MQNRDKTKSNMGMVGRATSTHSLMVDSARIPTVFVRETPNVSRRHTCKTETKPRTHGNGREGNFNSHSTCHWVVHQYNSTPLQWVTLHKTPFQLVRGFVVCTKKPLRGAQIDVWYLHNIHRRHHMCSAHLSCSRRPLQIRPALTRG